jgi:hypothetical protein
VRALNLAGNASYAPAVHTQRLQFDPVTPEVLKVQSTFRRFHKDGEEYQRSRNRERLFIPTYNIQLSQAVAAFHQHIQDMHHRHVDCKLCRQYVSRIKELAKRIDACMNGYDQRNPAAGDDLSPVALRAASESLRDPYEARPSAISREFGRGGVGLRPTAERFRFLNPVVLSVPQKFILT